MLRNSVPRMTKKIELMKQSIKELYQYEMRLYAGRKQQLRSNKSKLIGFGVSELQRFNQR